MESNTITLDDFILEMMKIPSRDLQLEQLDTLFQSLDLNSDLIQKNIFFNEESYARNLVSRTPRFDMLVLCWKPGQVTTVHDHVNSLNVTRVFEGTLTARNFEVVERPSEEKAITKMVLEEVQGKDCLSNVDFGGIHQLANTSDKDLITIHVYAPPLKDITVYYTSGNFERVPLRYTLEDEFA